MTSNVKTMAGDSALGAAAAALTGPSQVETVGDRFVLIGDYFPILLCVSPVDYTEDTVRQMAEAFEQYFIRGTRYAVITLTPNHARPPDAKHRKLVTDWINSPRVRSYSSRLCLGSANIVPNALMRGLHTALLWAWSPPFPMKPVASAREALDYAIEALETGGVPLPSGGAAVRVSIQKRLHQIMG